MNVTPEESEERRKEIERIALKFINFVEPQIRKWLADNYAPVDQASWCVAMRKLYANACGSLAINSGEEINAVYVGVDSLYRRMNFPAYTGPMAATIDSIAKA